MTPTNHCPRHPVSEGDRPYDPECPDCQRFIYSMIREVQSEPAPAQGERDKAYQFALDWVAKHGSFLGIEPIAEMLRAYEAGAQSRLLAEALEKANEVINAWGEPEEADLPIKAIDRIRKALSAYEAALAAAKEE